MVGRYNGSLNWPANAGYPLMRPGDHRDGHQFRDVWPYVGDSDTFAGTDCSCWGWVRPGMCPMGRAGTVRAGDEDLTLSFDHRVLDGARRAAAGPVATLMREPKLK